MRLLLDVPNSRANPPLQQVCCCICFTRLPIICTIIARVLHPGGQTIRFKVDTQPAAIELCSLSGCNRYLCLVASDTLTVYDRGCAISLSDARVRMRSSVAGLSIGCLEVAALTRIYLEVRSRTRLQSRAPINNQLFLTWYC